MKTFLLLLFISTFGMYSLAEAQLREDLNRSSALTGPVYNNGGSSGQSGLGLTSLFNSVDMEMGHSYSMSFGSFGGQFQNMNAYTNHMAFNFSENLTGNVDVSFLHSPFGNSFTGMGGQGIGTRVIIDRAQLDYRLSPNTNLSIQFSQRPYYYSPHYFGTTAGPFGRRNFWY